MWGALNENRMKPVTKKQYIKGAESPLQEEARLIYLENKARMRVSSLQKFYRSLKKKETPLDLVVHQEPEIPVRPLLKEKTTVELRRLSVVERLDKMQAEAARKRQEWALHEAKKEKRLHTSIAEDEEVRRHMFKQAERKRRKALIKFMRASLEKEKMSFDQYQQTVKLRHSEDPYMSKDLNKTLDHKESRYHSQLERYDDSDIQFKLQAIDSRVLEKQRLHQKALEEVRRSRNDYNQRIS